jgi:hypothetical protein
MSLFSTLPLDPAHTSLWTKLATQPYPAVPHGLGISEGVWQATLHPLSVAAVSVVYIFAVHHANHKRLRNGPARDLVKEVSCSAASGGARCGGRQLTPLRLTDVRPLERRACTQCVPLHLLAVDGACIRRAMHASGH